MLRVGIVGFGFMGRMHYNCWKNVAGAEVSAICDADPDVIGKTDESHGNIAGAEGSSISGDVQIHSDFEKMLAEGNLNAVSITVPTHLHARFSVRALKAGLHVLCEKPMALSMTQCRDMMAAAQKSGTILQIGHCIRFWPEYAKAREIVEGGEYGKVVAASFHRLCSAPWWSEDSWFLDVERSGGMAMDLHIHDTDFVQYLFGMPQAVRSFGAEGEHGGLVHIATQYLYGDDKVVSADGSWAMAASFGFRMSFVIAMEKGTIAYDCRKKPALEVFPNDGDAFAPEVEAGDGYLREIDYFARLVGGEKLGEVTSLEQSCNSIALVLAEGESVRRDEKIVIERG